MSRKNRIPGLSEPGKAEFLDKFILTKHLKFHAQLSWHEKGVINLAPGVCSVSSIILHK